MLHLSVKPIRIQLHTMSYDMDRYEYSVMSHTQLNGLQKICMFNINIYVTHHSDKSIT